MTDLIREALSACNLPLTMVLGAALFYWLLVIFGLVDLEAEGGGDDTVGDHAPATGGAWTTAGNWLGFRNVPLAIWGSFLILFVWVGAVILNYYFNGQPGNRDVLVAWGLLIPNMLVSLVLVRLVTWPIGRLFRAMGRQDTEAVRVLGARGRVVSFQITERSGQLEIPGPSSPVLLNARVLSGADPLPKGALAIVLEASPDGLFHYVGPVEDEESHQN